MIEPNPDQHRGAAQPRHLAWLELDRMRVLLGRGQAFGIHAIAAHCLDQGLEIGGRRYDPRFLLRQRHLGTATASVATAMSNVRIKAA